VSAEEVRALLDRLGWSQGELARRIGAHRVSVNQWATGVREPPPVAQTLLRVLANHGPGVLLPVDQSRT
jgi:DNA-binding transcriptional regulator YiaG